MHLLGLIRDAVQAAQIELFDFVGDIGSHWFFSP
jgi:hypothetical protein